MKRSALVTLVLSGSLLAGCDEPGQEQVQSLEEQNGFQDTLTNNTYLEGQGYWHAPFHAWYPFPYNDYRPGLGYYAGGRFLDHPDTTPVTVTTYRSRSGTVYSSGGSLGVGSSSSHSSSISRGGFGGSAHSAGS